MPQVPFVTTEIRKSLPILIIDHEGSLGLGLYGKLKDHVQTVLVGGREPAITDNLLFLRFRKSIPSLPQDQYSHIFFIPENEKELLEFLPVFIKKTELDNAKLLLVIKQGVLSYEKSEAIATQSKTIICIFLGDIFGNPFSITKNDRVEHLVRVAKQKQTLHLSNMGLLLMYPIDFTDVIREILRVAFVLPSSTKYYFAGFSEGITELTIAHEFQKLEPLIKIDFSKTVGGRDVPRQQWYFLLPKGYPVQQLLSTYFKACTSKGEQENYFEELAREENETIPIKPTPRKKIQIKKFLQLLTVFIVASIFLPIIIFLLGIGSSYLLLNASVSSLEKGNVEEVLQTTNAALTTLAISQKAGQMLLAEGILLEQPPALEKFVEKTQTGNQIASALLLGTNSLQTFKNLFRGQNISTDTLTQAIDNGKAALLVLQKVVKEGSLGQKESQVLEKISKFTPGVNVLDSIPTLVGMESPRTYLILFQNNTELRPGGGFIGSYGLLSLEKGKVQSFSIHDVYDADGQLKGHVEPPFPIRRYLPSVHLYLRDSNFDVDYPKNAYIAAILLQQELNQQVDGVIAVDLSFVRSIVESLGNVYVPEYQETVTANNMFLLTENHAEKNFFPGSTQKKDFLRSLFIAIQTKLANENSMGIGFLGHMLQAIQEKHVLFAFSDQSAQELFTANGFSSSLWDSRTEKNNTINDFLGINEANLGINKVNYWIHREVSQQVAISDKGEIVGQSTVKFTNTSTGVWPGGGYKNYLRFILPQGTILKNVIINGQEQVLTPAATDPIIYEASNFVIPAGLEVEHTVEDTKELYGMFLTIPAGGTLTISAIYTYSQKIDTTAPVFQYSLELFKQPGTENYPYTLSLVYPSSFRVFQKTQELSDENNTVSFTGILSSDRLLTASFAKR